MKFGLLLPTSCEGVYLPSSFASTKEIGDIAVAAEKLGFYSVWGNEFITPTPSMKIDDPAQPNFYELLVTLAYIAALTNKVKIGTLTLSLPLREPIILAKQISTIDVLSGGRFVLGIGLGAYRDEFESVHPRQSAANRGEIFLEELMALQLLFSKDDAGFRGRYFQFEGVSLNPKPNQIPVPIYLAGTTADTPRRVAQFGSGWLLSRTQKESLRERIERLTPYLEEVGRKRSDIDLVVTRGVSIAMTTEKAWALFEKSVLSGRTGGRSREDVLAQNLVGTSEGIVEQIANLQAEGIDHMVAQHFAANTLSEMGEQVEMFAREVMPAFMAL